MKTFLLPLAGGALALLSCMAAAGPLEEAIHELQITWARANYEIADSETKERFKVLTRNAESVVERFPGRAEPLIWEAIIVSSDAGKNGGLSALGKVKKARDLLLEAEKLDAHALDGSVYTSLGSLHYQVPGWPIGFGDDDKAEAYLKKALALNPQGIDPNYFYGDFLLDEKRYPEAVDYLTRALNAPAREGRPVADKGRRNEVRAKLEIARQKAGTKSVAGLGV